MKQSTEFVQSRFRSIWSQYCRERGWNESDAFAHLSLMRSSQRGEATELREEIIRRLRDPSKGEPMSFPNIARMVGYRSHGACIAAMRRSAVA